MNQSTDIIKEFLKAIVGRLETFLSRMISLVVALFTSLR